MQTIHHDTVTSKIQGVASSFLVFAQIFDQVHKDLLVTVSRLQGMAGIVHATGKLCWVDAQMHF
jgi:hypothetical protein